MDTQFYREGNQSILTSGALAKNLRQRIAATLGFYDKHLGHPRLNVVAGLVGSERSVLGLQQQFWEKHSDPTFSRHITYSWGDIDYEKMVENLVGFLDYVWDCYGVERPKG
jgi:hypothetical protein